MAPYSGDQLYGKQFGDTIDLLAQQMTSLTRSRVMSKRVANAEDAYFHQIEALDAPEANTDRHGDTPVSEATLLRRVITPYPFEKGYLLDRVDVARMVVSPENAIVQSLGAAYGRFIDDKVIEAAFADAKIGKAGGSTVAFKDESISLNGTTGGVKTTLGTLAAASTPVTMELAKILAMAQIYDEANVPETTPKYWLISPKCKRAMMDIEEITSQLYSDKRLTTGSIGVFDGFEFIVTNRLTKDAASSTAYRTLSWSAGGIGLAFIQDLNVEIDRRTDKKNSTQIYSSIDLGAVRTQGGFVHECLNVI